MRLDNVVKLPLRTKLVCSSCGAPGEGSCHCGVGYVPWKEKAAADAVADPANAGKSHRVLAEELGVSHQTIHKARKRSTVNKVTVEARTGKDGRTRKMPNQTRVNPGRRRKADEPQLTIEQERALARAVLDQGKSLDQAAKEAGLAADPKHHGNLTARFLVAREQGRREAEAEFDVDPETLALSAKAKLEIAKRRMERLMASELAERMAKIDEEVRQRVVQENKEYLARLTELENKARENEQWYRELINNRKPIFTVEQFKLIRMCLHPDGERSKEKLHAAFLAFKDKSVQLTGQQL